MSLMTILISLPTRPSSDAVVSLDHVAPGGLNANRAQKLPPVVVPNTSSPLRGDGGAHPGAPSRPNPLGDGVGGAGRISTAPRPLSLRANARTCQRPVRSKRNSPRQRLRPDRVTLTGLTRPDGETASTRTFENGPVTTIGTGVPTRRGAGPTFRLSVGGAAAPASAPSSTNHLTTSTGSPDRRNPAPDSGPRAATSPGGRKGAGRAPRGRRRS